MINERDLEIFNTSADKLIHSTFILADNKIGNFLTAMGQIDDIYYLLANSLKGFDYEKANVDILKGNALNLPTNPSEMIAYVFCLLVNIHDKKINFYEFLNQYFVAKNINEAYENFAITVIIPFKNVINVLLTGNEEGVKVKEKTIADELADTCKELAEASINFKGCANSGIILEGMVDAAIRGNMELFEALKVALLNSTKNRKFKKIINERFV